MESIKFEQPLEHTLVISIGLADWSNKIISLFIWLPFFFLCWYHFYSEMGSLTALIYSLIGSLNTLTYLVLLDYIYLVGYILYVLMCLLVALWVSNMTFRIFESDKLFLQKEVNKFQFAKEYDLTFIKLTRLGKSFDLSKITELLEETICIPPSVSDYPSINKKLWIFGDNVKLFSMSINDSEIRSVGLRIHQFLNLPSGTFKSRRETYGESVVIETIIL